MYQNEPPEILARNIWLNPNNCFLIFLGGKLRKRFEKIEIVSIRALKLFECFIIIPKESQFDRFYSSITAYGNFQAIFSDRNWAFEIDRKLEFFFFRMFSDIRATVLFFFVQNKLTRKQQIKLAFKKFPVWDCFRRAHSE